MLKIGQLLEKVQPRNNVHITHFEDMAFYGGYGGSIRALKMATILMSNPSQLLLSAKYDGSPTIFFGPAPVSGEFFVATKGIFNNSPQIFKSEEEVTAKYDGDMAKKLIYALRYLPELKPRSILQGDLLYVKGNVKRVELKSKPYLAFHPNTLYYAVLDDTPEAAKIKQSQIGIVLHTKWTGEAIDQLRPLYEVVSSDYEESSNVYTVNPVKEVIIKEDKLKAVKKAYLLAKDAVDKIQSTLDKLAANPKLGRIFEQHHNQLIRQSKEVIDAEPYAISLKKFVGDKNLQSLQISDQELLQIVIFHKMMTNLKMAMYAALDTNDEILAFVKKTDAVTFETDIEGYIIGLNKSDKPLKLVDRGKFSAYNFDDDKIQRGWIKKTKQT